MSRIDAFDGQGYVELVDHIGKYNGTLNTGLGLMSTALAALAFLPDRNPLSFEAMESVKNVHRFHMDFLKELIRKMDDKNLDEVIKSCIEYGIPFVEHGALSELFELAMKEKAMRGGGDIKHEQN